jgi:HAD superfamily 5'-nucleotidase-like hydrolase
MSEAPPPIGRVYCCRSLRLDHVRMVGFDMDYTLAIYNQPEMDQLQIRATLQRLVERGYPDELAELQCPTDFPIRGLLVDVRRGNVLKMDRYRYVKVAYHGLEQLSRAQRRELYESRRLRPGVDRYTWVDTLYTLADVAVYAASIQCLERRGLDVDYRQLFADVRACADLAHASGEVNATLESDFDRYLRRDPELGRALDHLRAADKQLFLLTNSRAAQSEPIMRYLLDDALPDYGSWRDYFDVVITSAAKPTFFQSRKPFGVVGEPAAMVDRLSPGVVYEGGNIIDFERLVGRSGTEVLYVGDHIYGDVLRANVESGWRTVMIIQEMAEEMAALSAHGPDIVALDALDLELRLAHDELRAAAAGDRSGLATLAERAARLERERDEFERRIDAAFHPYWGSLFKAGTELSSFGAQVEQYAWLYTERVSNLRHYSPLHFFRSPRALMAHEQ